MQTISKQELLSPPQFARATGLTIGAVYMRLWNGRLPAEKLYGRWLIPARAVRSQLKRRPKAEAEATSRAAVRGGSKGGRR